MRRSFANVLNDVGAREEAVGIKERVLTVVREVLVVDQDTKNILEASLKDDLALTSLEQLTLFIALEDEFDRKIPQEEAAGIETVEEIIQYIKAQLPE